MANITIITVGTLKESYLKDAVAEYKKRLSQYARVEEINLKEERIQNEEDQAEIRRALDAEGDKILSAIPKDSFKIAMCVEGKEYDSPALAALMGRAADEKGRIALVIGSSHGLAERVKTECDARLSLSKLTFPHQLMRVMMLEIIYRAMNIIKGTKYHK
jgi:23S rRNA (pseudouridine1915-N3)-methyltransferase